MLQFEKKLQNSQMNRSKKLSKSEKNCRLKVKQETFLTIQSHFKKKPLKLSKRTLKPKRKRKRKRLKIPSKFLNQTLLSQSIMNLHKIFLNLVFSNLRNKSHFMLRKSPHYSDNQANLNDFLIAIFLMMTTAQAYQSLKMKMSLRLQ